MNSLKTIFAKFQQVNADTGEVNDDFGKTIKTLEQLGVTTGAVTGELLPVGQILQNLASKWDTLSTKQQQMVATTLGERQISRFNALVQGMVEGTDGVSRSQQIYQEVMNASGETSRQYEEYLDSLSGSLGRLQAQWEVTFNNSMSSDTLKTFVDLGTSTLQFVDNIGALKVVLFALTTVLLLSNKAFKTWLVTINIAKIQSFSATLQALGSNLLAGVVQLGLVKGATLALGTAFEVVKIKAIASSVGIIALQGALTMGLSVAITAGITLLAKFADKLINAKDEAKAFNAELTQSVQESSKSIAEVESLFAKSQSLQSELSNSKSTEEQKKLKSELLEVQRQIAGAMGETTSGFDEEGNAISANSDLIREQIELKKQEMILNAQRFMDKNNTEGIEAQVEAYQTLRKEVESLKLAQAQGKDKVTLKGTFIDQYGMKEEYAVQVKVNEALEDKNKKMQEILKTTQQHNIHAQTLNKFNNDNIKIIELQTDATKKYTQAKEEDKNKLNEVTETEDALTESIKGHEEAIKTLTSAIKEYNDKGSLSLETVVSLLDKYPELNAVIASGGSVYDFLMKKQKEEVENQRTALNLKLMSNAEFSAKIMAQNSTWVSDMSLKYGVDLKNFATIQEGKIAILNKLKEAISQANDAFLDYKAGDINLSDAEYNALAKAKSDAQSKLKSVNADFDGIVNKYTGQIKGVGDNLKGLSSSSSSGSKSSSTSSTPTIFNASPLNKYDSAIQTINDSLSKTDDTISTISQKISNLQSLESKSNYADIIDLENSKLAEQNKKLSQLSSSKTQAQSLQDQIKSEFYSNWSSLKGRDLNGLTDTDWTNLYNQMYGKDINFGTGDKAKAEEQKYQDGAKKFQDLRKSYESASDLIKKLADDELKVQQDINSTIKEKIDYQIKGYDLQLDNQQKTISQAQDKIDTLDSQKINNFKEKIELNEGLLKANNDNLKIMNDIRDSLVEQLKSLSELKNPTEWNLITNAISDYNDKIQDSTKSIRQQEKVIKDIKKSQLEFVADTESEIVNALEKQYEKELKLAKDSKAEQLLILEDYTEEQEKLVKSGFKTRLELFEDEHDKIVETLDKELKLYDEIYNAKIKEIDKQEDTADYEKELNKKQQDKLKLQSQYNSLLLDSSLGAKSQREEISKQLSEKEEEIQEFIHSRSIELRKENLKDELDKNKERIQDKIDKENKAYEIAKEKYDQEIKALEFSNEKKLESDKLYAEARRLLMDGNLKTLATLLSEYGSNSEQVFSSMGQSIKDEILTNLKEAVSLTKQLGSTTGSSSSNNAESYDLDKYYNDPELAVIQSKWQNAYLNGNVTDQNEYKNQAQTLLNKYKVYKSGGLNTSTGFHWLDGTDTRPEMILNAEQTSAMIGIKDYLPKLMDFIKTPLASLPNLQLPSFAGVGNMSPVELNIDNLIRIDGDVMDKNIVSQIQNAGNDVMNTLVRKLNSKGKKV